MSPLTEPTRLTLRKSWQPMDADAAAYISAVEAADTAAGQSGGLEEKTKIAIDNFILGCKADGIWSAIKASCILAGARTLAGALVPLVGTAPTNVGPFVAGDYNRKTGLVGNGSSKYLNSNRNNNADPQDNVHLAVYCSTLGTQNTIYIGGSASFNNRIRGEDVRLNGTSAGFSMTRATGLVAASRNSSTFFLVRNNGSTVTATSTSAATGNVFIAVFGVNNSGTVSSHTDARLAFYSIGESLNLALLDARVTDLINAFGAAIP